ncbi:ACP S-malonyltransferase [Pseudobdellovibrio exovorus]|uniref:Malonyl CoA-acyl carrier protein transacylase n=1 Tax=Pseudobdellovibrio exovorus JSS TaxID=1184267 RepID=M4V830_9BACT|nr:ACP S-malonyltransferase [Pseudobdellovibrio exovorus]AGH95537.1 malonyl CoA-acyl carrier protein transacylase [Pseudobdellovibrio exovorus JSS]
MNAFLFPGQGSQAPNMGAFLFENFEIARRTFEEASDAISLDLKKLCFNSSVEELALTENTQPALLTVSTATARVLTQDLGVKPTITAGHSIGEYASFVLSQSLIFSDAVRAVRLRGQAMQSAVPVGQGGMTATLGLNEEQAQFLCDWAVKNSGSGPLSPANYNCDGQIVISGNMKTLDWLKTNFKADILPGEARRAKLIPLQVSAPFHCEMMKPAQEKMAEFFLSTEVKNAQIPIIQNVHAQSETDAAKLKENLIAQVSAPVKWTQSMQTLKSLGGNVCFEVGHGAVLKGLLKKIDGDFFKVYSTSSMDDLKAIEGLSK